MDKEEHLFQRADGARVLGARDRTLVILVVVPTFLGEFNRK